MVSRGPVVEEAGGAVASAVAAAERFGPNSAEVASFIEAVDALTAAQWRKVVAAARQASLVLRGTAAPPAESVRMMLQGGGDRPPEGPAAELNRALGRALGGKGDDKIVAAWQAASALARRRQLAALTFAGHYAPFAEVIPVKLAAPQSPDLVRYLKQVRALGAEAWSALARPWELERELSGALLQAAARAGSWEAEEAAATAAIAAAPKHLQGDAGWAAVKTVVHGARVLGCRGELTVEQQAALWAPLEAAIALVSLDDDAAEAKPPRPARKPGEPRPERPRRTPARRGPLYGPNHAEVAAFIKAVIALTPIQWLRVIDRRQLVASITRERSAEPAPVVRASLAAIARTRDLDVDVRCRLYAAVERAAYALESRESLGRAEAVQHYGVLADVVPFDGVDAATFAERLTGLNPEEWMRLAALAPDAQAAAVAPLVHAGDALAATLAARSDAEAAVAWHAVAALVQRQLLSPIKFATSFAPFGSALVVVRPRSLSPALQRYLTAIGRVSANQCAVLAEPWTLADDASNALSRASVTGATRAAEEAAALTALVTVPMRLTGDAGWAAAKTATFGARVIACRDRLSTAEFETLWKPLERAIPLASLESPARTK